MAYFNNQKARMRAGKKKVTFRGTMANAQWITLFDRAATGDLDAIMKLAEGYLLGSYGEKNLIKARKWASFAAKREHPGARELLEKIKKESG